MTSSAVKLNNLLRRSETKKSHSWWWDSHISPKNSKWLSENLEEMDQSVKRMLKLIEEDADSFAKKAEIYFRKRPELVAHVEEFYRMYRSLAERYDHVTGELKKNIPSDLQSQGSGISDPGSDPNTSLPSPDQRPSRPKLYPQAAGFEVFLGSSGSTSDFCNKEDDSSTVDYESSSDDSSINNFRVAPIDGGEEKLRRRVVELEVELHDLRQKLRGSSSEHRNYDDLLMKIAEYEREMRDARAKILVSDKEITQLKSKLERVNSRENDEKVSSEQGEAMDGLNTEVSESEKTLEGELRITREKLKGSNQEIANLRNDLENSKSLIQRLQDQLKTSQKDVMMYKSKVDKEHREVSKLLDRIARYKTNLWERDQEIRALRETISNANKSLSDENLQLQADVTKLMKERMYLEDNLREWDLRCQSLEEEVRRLKAVKTEVEEALKSEIGQMKVVFKDEIDDMNEKVKVLIEEVSSRDDRIVDLEGKLKQLRTERVVLIDETEKAHELVEGLRSKIKDSEREIERQKEMIREGAEEKREAIRQLCFCLEHYRDECRLLRRAFVGNKRLPPVMVS